MSDPIDNWQGRAHIDFDMTPQELKRQREAAGLSIQQLAAQAGVSWRSVYRWEGGEPISALGRIALSTYFASRPTVASATPQDHVSRIAVPSRKSKRTRK